MSSVPFSSLHAKYMHQRSCDSAAKTKLDNTDMQWAKQKQGASFVDPEASPPPVRRQMSVITPEQANVELRSRSLSDRFWSIWQVPKEQQMQQIQQQNKFNKLVVGISTDKSPSLLDRYNQKAYHQGEVGSGHVPGRPYY